MQNLFKFKFLLIFLAALFLLGGLFFYDNAKFNDGKLHIIFCDVGQGDAIYIRTPDRRDIIFDGGPDDSILSCLSKHQPFWDRNIELMILSHPHADHLNGLTSVMERYSVLYFVSEKLENDTASFKELKGRLKVASNSKKTKVKYVYEGDSIKFGRVLIKILAPGKSYLQEKSPNGKITDSKEFSSLIMLLSFGTFDLLLTGDSQTIQLQNAIQQINPDSNRVEVLQIPHHGSKTGANELILNVIRPKLAVISVGRNNRYGHPAKQVLDSLKNTKTTVYRTDLNGEIEVVTNGNEWNARSK